MDFRNLDAATYIKRQYSRGDTNMNIILLEHMDDLGTVGQTVKVKDGYARNYLLPRKLACLATDKNLKFYKTLIEAKQKKIAKAKDAADLQATNLSSITLTFIRKSRDQDARLFGSVTNADVAAALEEKGFEFDRRRISLSEPIKKLGEYTASVRLHPQVVAQVKVVVSPEDETDVGK
jgi:large subunit ribosomal protein L9